VDITFRLNGRPVHITVDRDESLVVTLRRLGQYTSRESCGVGLCGCCAVRVDGQAVSACLYWSLLASGAENVTLPGLADHPPAAPSRYRRRRAALVVPSAAMARRAWSSLAWTWSVRERTWTGRRSAHG